MNEKLTVTITNNASVEIYKRALKEFRTALDVFNERHGTSKSLNDVNKIAIDEAFIALYIDSKLLHKLFLE